MNKNMQIYFCTISIAIIFFSSLTAEVPLIPRLVLFGEPDKTCVRISPDGTKLAYIAPVDGVLNIWVKTLDKEDDHPITHERKRRLRKFSWAYNNTDILYLKDKDGDENWHVWRVNLETTIAEDLTPFEGVQASICAMSKYFPDELLVQINKENKTCFDVYHLDLKTGGLRLCEKNPGHVEAWSADSHLHVRAALVFEQDGGATILIRDEEKSDWIKRELIEFEDVMTIMPAGFSHDGRFFYVVDSVCANTLCLVKIDCKTGERRTIIADETCDVAGVLFDQEAEEPLAVAFNQDRFRWKSLCSKFDKDLTHMLATHDGDLISVDRSVDDTKWVLGFENDATASAYYLYDRTTKKTKFLFYLNPAVLKYQLAPMKPISFRSRDGLTINGYLTCPAEKSAGKLPLILYVHGGPWSRDKWGFNGWMQLFANRGYACLSVNFRGSTGYGKQFLNAGNKEWGRKMHEDLIDAVNWAIKEGIADPKKIAIYGGSYGGYAALCGAAFTPEVFCCAIDLCGISDLATWIRSFPPYWEQSKKICYKQLGNPDTEAEFLKSRSPLFKVSQIKIPLLIAQGANDPRVKQAEAEQIVAALKARGLPYEYMLFPDEGHGLARRENRMKFTAAVERFLAKHLGGRVEE